MSDTTYSNCDKILRWEKHQNKLLKPLLPHNPLLCSRSVSSVCPKHSYFHQIGRKTRLLFGAHVASYLNGVASNKQTAKRCKLQMETAYLFSHILSVWTIRRSILNSREQECFSWMFLITLFHHCKTLST